LIHVNAAERLKQLKTCTWHSLLLRKKLSAITQNGYLLWGIYRCWHESCSKKL